MTKKRKLQYIGKGGIIEQRKGIEIRKGRINENEKKNMIPLHTVVYK